MSWSVGVSGTNRELPVAPRTSERQADDHRHRPEQRDPDPESEPEQTAFGRQSDGSGSSTDIDDRNERDHDTGDPNPPIRARHPLRDGGEHEQQRGERPQAQCPTDRAIR